MTIPVENPTAAVDEVPLFPRLTVPRMPTWSPKMERKMIPPERPESGTMGRKCVIKANHFLVDLCRNAPYYKYDVIITPKEMATSDGMRRFIMKHITLSENLVLAYDGDKTAYSASPLPFKSHDFVVQLSNKFNVSIKYAGKKDIYSFKHFLSDQSNNRLHETIQILHVLLHDSSPSRHDLPSSCGPYDYLLQDGVHLWEGSYRSLRPTQMGLSLNVDVRVRTSCYRIPVLQYVRKLLDTEITKPLPDQDLIKVKNDLRGVRVQVYLGKLRFFSVQGLSVQPSDELNFVDKTGATKTLVQYFREKYNIHLRFPFLPAIQAGTKAKPMYLPMEICWLPSGSGCALKLHRKEITNFLKATCQRPENRKERIMKIIQHYKYGDELVKQDFGMRVIEQFTSVDARVLTPPTLRYHESGRSFEVNPSFGQWNMTDLKLINGGTVNYWAVVNFSTQSEFAVKSFCHDLVQICQNKGLVFNSDPLIPIYSALPNNVEKILCEANDASGKHLQLLIVILPDKDTETYARVKRVCETELGIVSQCCRPQHVMKPFKKYFENIALKINVKVGGRNHVLAATLNKRIPCVTLRPTIIFGAFVTHPSSGVDSSPSIASVVASMDWPNVCMYKALVSGQPNRQEVIQDLYTSSRDSRGVVVHGGLIRELLMAFKESTGHKPHRVLFYRCGVSEGQFNQVLLQEVDAIRKACISLEENYMPPVTFVTVRKSHHTRFFSGNGATTDKSGNIAPGTVVDTSICHPTEYDFYLCSHAGIQGTSCPAHYHVLYDENEFTPDGLQTLTYFLCYTYARCTRSVSIVPPAYYARLAANHARIYMEDPSDGDSHEPRSTRDKFAELRPLPIIHEKVKSVMFYC